MTITATPTTAIKRIYPHVTEIADWQTQATVRLLWDRVHDLTEQLQAAQSTVTNLVDGHNTNAATLESVGQDARQALASQSAGGGFGVGRAGSGAGAGGGAGAPLPGLPGSQTNPIIAMSADPATIAASVRLSLAFYGLPASSDQYWIGKASTAEQFSNGKWYLGWNAYWEARAAPGNPGSADPNLGGVPAPHGALPAGAPNMTATLNTVAGSQTWKFDGGDAYDQTQPNGRGAFTEAAVAACHAIDPRWGHIKKNPGQNQYNGHAVDFMVWKNPDGVTAEGYDILSTTIHWNFGGRDANLLAKWYF